MSYDWQSAKCERCGGPVGPGDTEWDGVWWHATASFCVARVGHLNIENAALRAEVERLNESFELLMVDVNTARNDASEAIRERDEAVRALEPFAEAAAIVRKRRGG